MTQYLLEEACLLILDVSEARESERQDDDASEAAENAERAARLRAMAERQLKG